MSKYRIKDTHNIRTVWRRPQIIGCIVEITDKEIKEDEEGKTIHPEGNKYCINFKLDDFELVEETRPKPKFKVGDKVKIVQRLSGNTTGCPTQFKPNGFVGYKGIVREVLSNSNIQVWSDDIKEDYMGIFTDKEVILVEDEQDESISLKDVSYSTGTVETNTYSYDEPIAPWKIIYSAGMNKINNNAPQEQTNNNMNQGLISKMKDLLMNEPKKTLLKYGIIDREENLTNEGKELFINFMFEQNKDKFIDEVVSVFVKAEEKDSKKK